MPGMDRTGPNGSGPATGWGRGPCRRGFGRGFALRRSSYEPTKQEEKKILEGELQEIEVEKKEILKRLKELK